MQRRGEAITVLHVDDKAGFADMVATILERDDHRLTVETATSVSEGLEKLQDHDYDCILADYEMPEQNGIEFLEAVRAEHPNLPFILFTGKGSEAVASEAISAGVTDYIQKGADISQYTVLAHRIRNAVEQYRSRQRIEASEQKLSELAEKADDILFMFSGDWSELLFINSSFEEIWGIDIDELRNDPSTFLEYIHPDDREKARESMTKLASGESDEIEYRVLPPSGDQRWVRGQSKPILDEDGTVERIVGYVRDITDQKRRSKELERYEAIVENSEDGVYVFNADGQFEFVNNRVLEVSGIPRQDWIGQPVSILTEYGALNEEDLAEVEAAIQAIANDDRQETRVELRPSTPHDLQVLELRLTRLDTVEGGVRVVGFSRDITDRVQYQEELERRNAHLNQFASIVSHDLRNPLTVAQGRLELLREDCDSDQIADIAAAHQRMEELIDDLLTLAREGETITGVEPVELATLLETCWQTIETDDATLEIESSKTIQADRSRLQQLLENLIRNAVEHGGDAVVITVGDLDDGFYVADDGPGIPEGNRDQVFETGFTGDGSGAGLGLAIVKQITSAHGWDIRVTSSADGGARFEITGTDSPPPTS